MKILWIFFGVITKLDVIKYITQGLLRSRYRIGDIFLGLPKLQTFFWGAWNSWYFFGVNDWCLARAYVWRENKSTPPPPLGHWPDTSLWQRHVRQSRLLRRTSMLYMYIERTFKPVLRTFGHPSQVSDRTWRASVPTPFRSDLRGIRARNWSERTWDASVRATLSRPRMKCIGASARADPGIVIRGVQARRPENSLHNVFLVLNLFYSLQFYCRENYSFPRIQRGSNIFRGSNFFQGGGGGGGVQMLISIETNITCNFQGGGGPERLSPSLDPHMKRPFLKTQCSARARRKPHVAVHSKQ